MKKQFVREIEPGDDVVDFFLVRSKNSATTKTGKKYLDLELQDRTGTINAKMWDRVEDFDPLFERGDVIKIKAVADTYRDKVQIKIAQLRMPKEDEPIDKLDYLPATDKDVSAMMAEMDALIESVGNAHVKALLEAFFAEPEFRSRFMTSVGARNIHHAYAGGLLEHTIQIARLADYCSKIYPEIDRDVLVAMTMLHDIGKVKELSSEMEILFTTDGYLMGHISLGLEMLDEKIKTIEGFPHELSLRLKHILLSHHGELEFGSPIVPKTAEAIILHYLDNLDAKTNLIVRAIANDKNKNEPFTEFNKTMGRNFYKGVTNGNDKEE